MAQVLLYDAVILSHPADNDAAAALQANLAQAGLRVWRHPVNDPTVPEYWSPIETALNVSSSVLILWGPHGLDRRQPRERDLAYCIRLARPDFLVLFVLLPESTPPQGSWANLEKWVCFEKGLDDPTVLSVLVQAIRRIALPSPPEALKTRRAPGERRIEHDVLIAYHRADSVLVEELAEWLAKEAGLRVWLDTMSAHPGEPWWWEIEEGMLAAEAAVLILGERGFGQVQWRERELAYSIRDTWRDFRVIYVRLPGTCRPRGTWIEVDTWAEFEETYLFSVGTDYCAELDRKELSEGLSEQFRARGRALSPSTRVEENASGDGWTLADRNTRQHKYYIRRADAKLEVYEGTVDNKVQLKALAAAIKGAVPLSPLNVDLPDEPAPYRGLESFGIEDAGLFFGRASETGEMLQRLQAHPFLAVIGASGSGKTSLVRAGLLAQLRQGAAPGSADWPQVEVRPGPDPWRSLARGLLRLIVHAVNVAPSEEELAQYLAAAENALCTVVDRLAKGRRLVLLVDKFEEVFTQCEDSVARERYIAALLYLARYSSAYVILTMRADFYGHCTRHPELADEIVAHQLLLKGLSPEGVAEAISTPAVEVGAVFEKGLSDQIRKDVGTIEGRLPLLEHTLDLLWRGRQGRWLTWKQYNEIGRVDGAISYHASRVLQERLTVEEREIARRLFTRLAWLSGSGREPAGWPRPKEWLLAQFADQEAAERVLQKLADERLVVIREMGESGENVVEIIHEALLEHWETLREWLEEYREFYLWRQQRLEPRVTEWQETGSGLLRDKELSRAEDWGERLGAEFGPLERGIVEASVAQREKERKGRERLRRGITIGLTAGLLIMVVLAGVALIQRGEAVNQANAASTAQAVARIEADVRATAQAEAEARRAEAERQQKIAEARAFTVQSNLLALESPIYYNTSVRLAIESVATYPTQEGTSALLQRASLLSRPVARLRDPQILGFCPNGEALITGDSGNILRIRTAPDFRASVQISHGEPIISAFCSPNGQWLAAQGESLLRVIEVATGGESFQIADILSANFSSDGAYLATLGSNEAVQIWKSSTGEEVERLQCSASIEGRLTATDIKFSPDGTKITVLWNKRGGSGESSVVCVWDTATGQEITHFAPDGASDIFFSPDSQRIITRDSVTVQAWDIVSGEQVPVEAHNDGIYPAGFSPDGKWFLSGNETVVRVLDAETQEEVLSFDAGVPIMARFENNGEWVVASTYCPAGCPEESKVNWVLGTRDPYAGQVVTLLTQEQDFSVETIFSADGRWAVTIGDTERWVWEVTSYPAYTRLPGPNPNFAVSPDGSAVAVDSVKKVAAGQDTDGERWVGLATMWNIASRQIAAEFECTGAIGAMVFSPDGSLIAVAEGLLALVAPNGSTVYEAGDNVVHVWNIATGEEVARLEHDDVIKDMEFSPDGRWLATGGRNNRLWDIATGEELARVSHSGSVLDASFSSDARWVISKGCGSEKCTFIILETETLQEATRLESSVCNGLYPQGYFSPDARYLVTLECGVAHVRETGTWQEIGLLESPYEIEFAVFGSLGKRMITIAGGVAQVWDLATREELVRMHSGAGILAAAFTPDEKYVITGGGSAYVWEIATGQELIRVPGPARFVAFTQDGRWAISAGGDSVQIWLWRPADLISAACQRLLRGFTPEEWTTYVGEMPFHTTCDEMGGPLRFIIAAPGNQQLNVRQGPGYAYDVVTSVGAGTRMEITGPPIRTEADLWWPVQLTDSTQGWVLDTYVENDP